MDSGILQSLDHYLHKLYDYYFYTISYHRGPKEGNMGMFYNCMYDWYLVKEPEWQFTELSAEHPQTQKVLIHNPSELCH